MADAENNASFESSPKRAKLDVADADGQPESAPFAVSFDFCNMTTAELEQSASGLCWKNDPAQVVLETGVGLIITPKPGTDYWRKSFRTPPSDRASGHALLYSVPRNVNKWKAETKFTLNPVVLYDQAGIMVFIDDSHWLKAGIEIDGEQPRMSCVITNSESDWSYLTWPTTEEVEVRIQVQRYSIVCEVKVEYRDENGQWCFLREGPISLPNEDADICVGLMCCSPKQTENDDQVMQVIFKSLAINEL